jgi:hypothetical protein
MSHDHLTDEQLSAHIDGESLGPSSPGVPATDDQISSCPQCRERLDALHRARALVRQPVASVSPAVKTAAVEAALTRAVSDPAGSPESAEVVTPLRRSARRSRLPAVTVAAAVVALAVVAGVAVTRSHAPSATSTASRAAAHAPTKRRGPADMPPRAAASGAGADLGSIGSLKALRTQLAPAFAAGRYNGEFGTSAGTSSTDQDQNLNTLSAGVPEAEGVTQTSCLDQARQDAGATRTLDLVATATYEGTPALVVVVERTGSSSDSHSGRLAVVVAQSGCRLLAQTTF